MQVLITAVGELVGSRFAEPAVEVGHTVAGVDSFTEHDHRATPRRELLASGIV